MEDTKFYKVINPINGKEEQWSGERIRKFSNIYNAEVQIQKDKKKEPPKEKEPVEQEVKSEDAKPKPKPKPRRRTTTKKTTPKKDQ